MTDDAMRTAARNRLKARADFRYQLLTWVGVSLLLVVIWLLTSPGGYFWPVWPIAGFGLAVALSGINAYGGGRRAISENDVDAEVRRMQQGGNAS